jgi:hypothetical protein
MRENDADVNIGLRTLNEVEALNSCILKYFNGKSESPPLNRDESLILSALDIYFNGERKYNRQAFQK